MKVIAGIPWRLDWEISGLAKRIEASYNAISDMGVDVTVYCLGPVTKKKKFSVKRVPVNTTKDAGVFIPLINSLGFSHEFSKLVSKGEYNVLHCFNTTSLFLTERRHLLETTNPTYAYALEVVKDEYPRNEKYQRLLKYYAAVVEIDRLEYENAELVVAKSEVVKNNIVRYYDIDKNKIEVIPNGVTSEECNFERPLKRREEMRIVIFPGTMHVMKGFPYLVQAMIKVRKEIPNAILLVCGRIHPYEYEIFKNLIDDMRKESGIVLAGFLPRETLFKYYHLADVCCIPLLFGSMSIAILESVAHGLPIVTTPHSGFPDVDKVGIKVPPKDSDAIAEAIITLLSDPDVWRRKSENARKVMRKYMWDSIAKEYVKIYKRFLE